MSDSRSVELTRLSGALENEFTPQQIANFKQAFSVFDVNKDGRISTYEIFEVLSTMGNEVSPERQQKIKAAVVAVDVDQSGDLDFPEFIQFMKIMDEHNKTEAVEAQAPDHPLEKRASWKYFSLFDIKIKLRKRISFLWNLIVWLGIIYGVGHAIFVGILISTGWNYIHQNPGTDTSENSMAWIVYIIRYVNYANAALILLNFTHEAKLATLYDALEYHGYKKNFQNLLKYVLRPLIVLNALSCVLFIIGIKDLAPDSGSVTDHWVHAAPAFATIVISYFAMSYFIYFETLVEPADFCDWIAVWVSDLLLFNWFRLVAILAKNVVLIALLPFIIVLTILMSFAQCCFPNRFDSNDSKSFTMRFLRIVALVSG